MFKVLVILGLLSFAAVSLSACAESVTCQKDNQQLQSMPALEIVLTREDGSQHRVIGKLADNDLTRAAGFQRVCESTIKARPILFDFERQLMPRFHMHNVVAPIDIAFIDQEGRIESIQSMKPYVLGSKKKPLYGPSRPIVAALEVHQGFFTLHNIDLNSSVSWRAAIEQAADADDRQ